MSTSNQSYDYDALMAKRKQRFIEVITQVSAIIFYDFIEFDKEVMQAFSQAEPQTIDARHWKLSNAEVIAWIKEILRQEKIVGDYLFTFIDYEIIWPMPMARVHLGESYEWVEPLWDTGRGFYFQNMARNKWLSIQMSEGNWEANLTQLP